MKLFSLRQGARKFETKSSSIFTWNQLFCCLFAVQLLGVILSPLAARAQDASKIGNGIISTFAGTAPGGNATGLDDVMATSWLFNSVAGAVTDASGNLYILDQSNNTVSMVYIGGTVPPLLQFRLAATRPPGYQAATATAGHIYYIAGIAANYASAMVPNSTGQSAGENQDPTCQTASTCGDGGSALEASLNIPAGIALDSAGNLYIADEGSNAVRKVTAATGKMSTIVGDPMHTNAGFSGENVTAAAALVFGPDSIALDASSNLFISDSNNYIIRKLTASTGKLTTVAGTAPPIYTFDGSDIVAMGCSANPCGDGGAATSATLGYATAVSIASNGDLYISDEGAETVRKVTAATAKIATVAGTMPPAGSNDPFPDECATTPCGDGGSATAAQLNLPYYAAPDADGNILIADYSNNALRFVSGSTGDIADAIGMTSFTGGYTGDTGVASAATLNTPQGFAFDPSGNLYIVDSGNLVIRKVNAPASLLPQTITFGPLPDLTYGTAPVTLDATASSGLAVSYTVTGPATVSGSTLHITGSGSVTVTANQSGNGTYSPATPIAQAFTVDQAALTVKATNLSREVNTSNPTLTYTVTGFVNGDSTSVVTGAPVLTTTAVTTSPNGNYPITVARGTLTATNYTFTLVNGTLSVTGETSQTITFAPLSNINYGSSASTFPIVATASSGLPVTFSVTGPAVLQGNVLTANGAGTVVVTAQQAGNSTYAAAPDVVRSFIVNPAPLTITAISASRPYDQPNPAFTFVASGFVGGDTAAVLSGGPVYSTTATTASAPGTYPVTLMQGTLFAANYTFTFVPGVLTIAQGVQTITFPPIPALTGSLGNTYTLQATSSAGLPVQYTATGVVSILAGGTLYVNGPGAATVTASQPGNADYGAAAPVTQSFTVGLVALTVQATSVSRPFGGANPVFTYTFLTGQGGLIPGSVTGIPTITTSATASSPTGTYPITISQGSLASSVYALTFASGTLTVTPPSSYTLTIDPSTVTVPSGQSRQVTVTLTPLNNYVGSVTLGCTGLPAGVTCTSSPAALTTSLNASSGNAEAVQATLTISAGQTVASASANISSLLTAGLFWLPAGLSGLLLVVRRRKLRRNSPLYFLGLAILMLASAFGVSACGGNSSGSTGSVKPGTTQVMVTGTGTQGAGSADTSQAVALTVIVQ